MNLKLFASLLLTLAGLQVYAADFIATNRYEVAADQRVADEQWVVAGLVTADGTFQNDLFAVSGNALALNGTYHGNIWGFGSAGAGLSGTAERNVRLAGDTVRIDGPIGGNLMAFAQTIMITTNAVIEGNVRLLGVNIVQEGEIRGRAQITAARILTLSGNIGQDATVLAPDILFDRKASIGGNLEYTANKELFPDEGIVQGELIRTAPKAEPLFSRARLVSRGLWFLAALMAGIPFISLFPMTTAMSAQIIRSSMLKCLLVGIVASGAIPIFGIMCISSLIGVPLGLLLLASWGILSYLSRIIAGLVIGSLLLPKGNTSIGRILLSMTVGLAIIYAAGIIPSIGTPVQLTATWIGMGAFLLALVQKRRLIIEVPKNLNALEQLKNAQQNPEEDPP